MANKPQTLSQGQREEVTKILRTQVLTWTLTGLALIGGVFGVGLWQMKERIETAVEAKTQQLIAQQFEEARIRKTLEEVASQKAAAIMQQSVQPEVDRFRIDIAKRTQELDALVNQTKALEEQATNHAKTFSDSLGTIRLALAKSQQVLSESQQIRDKLVGLQSDVIRMQKAEARIQYYSLKGRNTFPNPYQQQIVDALNEMVQIAIPDPAERQRFITQLGGPSL